MAIDTATLRRAVAGTPPVPDGTVGVADRRQVAGTYPIGVSEVTGVTSGFAVRGGATVEPADGEASVTVADGAAVAELLPGDRIEREGPG